MLKDIRMASFSVALDICPVVCTRTPGYGGKGGKAILYHDQHTSLSDYMSCYLISVLPRPVMVAKEARRIESSTSFLSCADTGRCCTKKKNGGDTLCYCFPCFLPPISRRERARAKGGISFPGSNKNCTLGNSGGKNPPSARAPGTDGRGLEWGMG